MPNDLFSMVVARERGFFEHLAEDEVSVLSEWVKIKPLGETEAERPCYPW